MIKLCFILLCEIKCQIKYVNIFRSMSSFCYKVKLCFRLLYEIKSYCKHVNKTQRFVFSLGHLNMKMSSYEYRDPHVKDKTVSRLSYFSHGNPESGKDGLYIETRSWLHKSVMILHNAFDRILARWHDDVIKWTHFPRYRPFVRGIHRSPVNSLHKGQWRGALMFSLICVWINGWVNNREAGDLRRYLAHYDVTAMWYIYATSYEQYWEY